MLGTQPGSPFGCVSHQKLWKIHGVHGIPEAQPFRTVPAFGHRRPYDY
jgi:hypothetical protein